MSNETKDKILHSVWGQMTLAGTVLIVIYLILSHLGILTNGIGSVVNFISPVIWGVIIAYIMDPLVKLMEHRVFHKMKSEGAARQISVALTVVLVIVLLAVLLLEVIPQIFSSIVYLISHMNGYADSLQGMLEQLSAYASDKGVDLTKLSEAGTDILDTIVASLSGIDFNQIINKSMSVGKNLFNLMLAFILAIYFLLDKRRLLNGCSRLMRAALSRPVYQRVVEFFSRCNTILVRYIAFALIDALIVGVANFIFMTICGMSYKPLVSIVAGVTNLAPTFGPIIGCIIGAFILLLTDPWHALLFIIFTIVLQIFDGYILKPRLFGNTLGVPGILILIAIIVGGRIFGMWGIILAIPFAAILDYVYQELFMPFLENRRRQKNLEEEESSEGEPETSDPA